VICHCDRSKPPWTFFLWRNGLLQGFAEAQSGGPVGCNQPDEKCVGYGTGVVGGAFQPLQTLPFNDASALSFNPQQGTIVTQFYEGENNSTCDAHRSHNPGPPNLFCLASVDKRGRILSQVATRVLMDAWSDTFFDKASDSYVAYGLATVNQTECPGVSTTRYAVYRNFISTGRQALVSCLAEQIEDMYMVGVQFDPTFEYVSGYIYSNQEAVVFEIASGALVVSTDFPGLADKLGAAEFYIWSVDLIE